MGAVYKALDLEHERVIALKVAQHAARQQELERFRREARFLSELEHPNIVEHVAHGTTDRGIMYMAMEWLEGRDLDMHLRKTALSQAEAIALGLQVCSALAVAHEHRIIHRDIKPANLFLVDGAVHRVKLLDFGIARIETNLTPLTLRGAFVGTPSFIAPEQARGDEEIDERVDLYSLGAVLFAGLTRRPPFVGKHVMAILAKLLFEPVPRLSDLRPDVSPGLEELIHRLLAKDPDERPGSAREIMDLLAEVRDDDTAAMAREARSGRALSHSEQRVFSVLLLALSRWQRDERVRAELDAVARRYQAELQRLADGTAVAVFSSESATSEMAMRAARCALALRESYPEVPIVITTGRGMLGERAPVGQVIDHAVQILFEQDTTLADQSSSVYSRAEIVLDEATASLIEKRFLLRPAEETCFFLTGEAPRPSAARTLLGKATRFVGREREICAIQDIFEECMAQSAARVVLVTGEEGAGKSRLAAELVHRLGERHERRPELAVWTAYGDPMRAGAALGLLAQIIRQALDVTPSEPLTERQHRIRSRIGLCFAGPEAERVSVFLGEIVSTPFPDGENTLLQEARRDARVMHDEMLQAWQDWLEKELERRPVLCVLEDLQWGDLPTIRFIDIALRNLGDRSFMVLAVARPQIKERFPDVWHARGLEQIALKPLSRQACMDLARHVLPDLGGQVLERLVELSSGNAFYLEELIRHAAAGKLTEIPDSVLALVAARLSTLSSEARRLLRAASVFGKIFWQGSVAALLDEPSASIAELLDRLSEQELVVKRRRPRFSGDIEYAFQHQLIREAAHAMLTEPDRVVAHHKAGHWLENAGETDVVTVAEHYWIGKQPGLALPCYHRAAEQALDADDLDATVEWADRAVACGANGQTLGALRLLQGVALTWKDVNRVAYERSCEASALLSRGSSRWAEAFHYRAWAASELGEVDEIDMIGDELIRYAPDEPDEFYVMAMMHCASILALFHRIERLASMQRFIDTHLSLHMPTERIVAAYKELEAILAAVAGNHAEAAVLFRLAFEHWEAARNQRYTMLAKLNFASCLYEIGQYGQSVDVLISCIAWSKRVEHKHLWRYAILTITEALTRSGNLLEARIWDQQLGAINDDPRFYMNVHYCRGYSALLQAKFSDVLSAVCSAEELCDKKGFSDGRAVAEALRAQALLGLCHLDEAVAAARRAMHILNSINATVDGNALVRLTYAEALHAAGQHDEAWHAICAARDELLARAARISNPEWRESFLHRVREHQRILELHQAWATERACQEPPPDRA